MRRLTKRDVERLLADYDRDPVGALVVALRTVTSRPDAGWDDLVDVATDDPARRERLRARDVDALDDLARELNELRGLDRPGATRTPTRGPASP